VHTRIFENSISRSLGLHVLVVLFLFVYVTRLSTPIQNTSPIEVTITEKKKETVEPAKKVDVAKADKKNKEEDKTKRMVQRSEGDAALDAKKNSYLSDKTRTVDEERSARNSGERDASKIQAVPFQPSGKPAHATKEKTPKNITVADLGVKIDVTTPKKTYEQERNWVDPQLGETVRGGEYITGLKEGETSALNTKESIFFSYFDRVRRQLDSAWEPILRENIAHIFKVGRRLASNTDYSTEVLITLNARGEIKNVQIIEESGTHDLDQAALDALNKAGPYPNPPKGLVDATGMVHMHWNFVLKT
jgi:TonB family protein